jgi:hypothetical protein
LSGPGDDFDEWFKEDQDIAEMRRSIEKDTPELSEIVDPHVLAAIGQRLKVVQFYEDAKHYFFSDLYPESPVVTRLNGEFSEIPIGHSGEAYTPTEDIKKILIFDPELWEGVKTIRPDGSEFQWVVDYCQTVMRSMWEVAPDDKTARLTNDGVNVIYSIIMYANFQEGGDARKLIDSGEDLVIARNMIIDKEERGYDNLAAYKLWAGLYLDLRETLFGVDQNERNIKLNDQLREAVNS